MHLSLFSSFLSKRAHAHEHTHSILPILPFFFCWNVCKTMFMFSVQQAPLCAYRADEPFLQWCPARVCGHSSDLWQIPWKERRAEGAFWQGSPEFLLPHKILGECHYVICLRYLLLFCWIERIYFRYYMNMSAQVQIDFQNEQIFFLNYIFCIYPCVYLYTKL